MYVKEIWPATKLISYLEWWFDPASDFFNYDIGNAELLIENSKTKSWLRNQQIALKLSSSDEIIAPTEWQRAQLPSIFRRRCHVIFDGIDLNTFSQQNEVRSNVITYGTRGMDPMRCFPQFVRAVAEVLKEDTFLKLEIAGEDRAFYGSKPVDEKSWGHWAHKYFHKCGISDRIQWKGKLKFKEYELWLKSSPCHVYLTHPFIASWSLVEAYCTGVPLVVSDVAPVREICRADTGIRYVNHKNQRSLAEGIHTNASGKARLARLNDRTNRSVSRFGLDECLEQWRHVAGVE